MREVFEEDLEDVEDDMMWCNPEFSQFSDISNIQESCIRKRFLPLQPSKVTVQLPKVNTSIKQDKANNRKLKTK
jgi:hypothetical protein